MRSLAAFADIQGREHKFITAGLSLKPGAAGGMFKLSMWKWPYQSRRIFLLPPLGRWGRKEKDVTCSSWHVLEANFYFCLVHKRLENESANDKWQKESSPFAAGPRLSERRANRSCAYLQVSGMLSSDFLCHSDVRLCDGKGGHLWCGTQL